MSRTTFNVQAITLPGGELDHVQGAQTTLLTLRERPWYQIFVDALASGELEWDTAWDSTDALVFVQNPTCATASAGAVPPEWYASLSSGLSAIAQAGGRPSGDAWKPKPVVLGGPMWGALAALLNPCQLQEALQANAVVTSQTLAPMPPTFLQQSSGSTSISINPSFREAYASLKESALGLPGVAPKQCLNNAWVLKRAPRQQVGVSDAEDIVVPAQADGKQWKGTMPGRPVSSARVFVSASRLKAALQDAEPAGDWIVQKYIERPLLIAGDRKFDMRMFVLLMTDDDGTEAYLYHDVLARCASRPYSLQRDEKHRSRGTHHDAVHNTSPAAQVASKYWSAFEDGGVLTAGELQDMLALSSRAADMPKDALFTIVLPMAKQLIVDCVRACEWQPGAAEADVQAQRVDPQFAAPAPDHPPGFSSAHLLEFGFVVDADLRPWLLGVSPMHLGPEVEAGRAAMLARQLADKLRPDTAASDEALARTGWSARRGAFLKRLVHDVVELVFDGLLPPVVGMNGTSALMSGNAKRAMTVAQANSGTSVMTLPMMPRPDNGWMLIHTDAGLWKEWQAEQQEKADTAAAVKAKLAEIERKQLHTITEDGDGDEEEEEEEAGSDEGGPSQGTGPAERPSTPDLDLQSVCSSVSEGSDASGMVVTTAGGHRKRISLAQRIQLKQKHPDIAISPTGRLVRSRGWALLRRHIKSSAAFVFARRKRMATRRLSGAQGRLGLSMQSVGPSGDVSNWFQQQQAAAMSGARSQRPSLVPMAARPSMIRPTRGSHRASTARARASSVEMTRLDGAGKGLPSVSESEELSDGEESVCSAEGPEPPMTPLSPMSRGSASPSSRRPSIGGFSPSSPPAEPVSAPANPQPVRRSSLSQSWTADDMAQAQAEAAEAVAANDRADSSGARARSFSRSSTSPKQRPASPSGSREPSPMAPSPRSSPTAKSPGKKQKRASAAVGSPSVPSSAPAPTPLTPLTLGPTPGLPSPSQPAFASRNSSQLAELIEVMTSSQQAMLAELRQGMQAQTEQFAHVVSQLSGKVDLLASAMSTPSAGSPYAISPGMQPAAGARPPMSPLPAPAQLQPSTLEDVALLAPSARSSSLESVEGPQHHQQQLLQPARSPPARPDPRQRPEPRVYGASVAAAAPPEPRVAGVEQTEAPAVALSARERQAEARAAAAQARAAQRQALRESREEQLQQLHAQRASDVEQAVVSSETAASQQPATTTVHRALAPESETVPAPALGQTGPATQLQGPTALEPNLASAQFISQTDSASLPAAAAAAPRTEVAASAPPDAERTYYERPEIAQVSRTQLELEAEMEARKAKRAEAEARRDAQPRLADQPPPQLYQPAEHVPAARLDRRALHEQRMQSGSKVLHPARPAQASASAAAADHEAPATQSDAPTVMVWQPSARHTWAGRTKAADTATPSASTQADLPPPEQPPRHVQAELGASQPASHSSGESDANSLEDAEDTQTATDSLLAATQATLQAHHFLLQLSHRDIRAGNAATHTEPPTPELTEAFRVSEAAASKLVQLSARQRRAQSRGRSFSQAGAKSSSIAVLPAPASPRLQAAADATDDAHKQLWQMSLQPRDAGNSKSDSQHRSAQDSDTLQSAASRAKAAQAELLQASSQDRAQSSSASQVSGLVEAAQLALNAQQHILQLSARARRDGSYDSAPPAVQTQLQFTLANAMRHTAAAHASLVRLDARERRAAALCTPAKPRAGRLSTGSASGPDQARSLPQRAAELPAALPEAAPPAQAAAASPAEYQPPARQRSDSVEQLLARPRSTDKPWLVRPAPVASPPSPAPEVSAGLSARRNRSNSPHAQQRRLAAEQRQVEISRRAAELDGAASPANRAWSPQQPRRDSIPALRHKPPMPDAEPPRVYTPQSTVEPLDAAQLGTTSRGAELYAQRKARQRGEPLPARPAEPPRPAPPSTVQQHNTPAPPHPRASGASPPPKPPPLSPARAWSPTPLPRRRSPSPPVRASSPPPAPPATATRATPVPVRVGTVSPAPAAESPQPAPTHQPRAESPAARPSAMPAPAPAQLPVHVVLPRPAPTPVSMFDIPLRESKQSERPDMAAAAPPASPSKRETDMLASRPSAFSAQAAGPADVLRLPVLDIAPCVERDGRLHVQASRLTVGVPECMQHIQAARLPAPEPSQRAVAPLHGMYEPAPEPGPRVRYHHQHRQELAPGPQAAPASPTRAEAALLAAKAALHSRSSHVLSDRTRMLDVAQPDAGPSSWALSPAARAELERVEQLKSAQLPHIQRLLRDMSHELKPSP